MLLVSEMESSIFSKKSYKFDFNPGHKFQFIPDQLAVEEINLNSNYQDKAKVREPLAYETYRKSGVLAPDSFQVRVQRNGKFFSIANSYKLFRLSME